MLSRKEKHNIFVKIGEAIDNNDWNTAIELGSRLKKHEVNNCRYITDLSKYQSILQEQQLSKITVTIYKGESNGINFLTTVKQHAKIRNISHQDAWKQLNNKTTCIEKFIPVAEVLEDVLKQPIEQYNQAGSYIRTDWYLDVALRNSIHVQDLQDLVIDGTPDRNGNTYKLIGGMQ